MYCEGGPEQNWIYYLCTDFATFSKWHYIIVYKQGAEGSHEHISDYTGISVMQSVIEWLVCHNMLKYYVGQEISYIVQ